jgi:transposase
MFIVPRIDRAQRRNLVRIGSKARDFATLVRFYAVALLGGGKSSPTVADILCISVSTVVRAAHAYLAEGIQGLYDKRLRNGRPKADGAFRACVTSLLRGTPEDFGWRRPTWTRELLCRQAEREGRPAVSVSTMGRALARIGARIGMPKPVVLCPWKRDARLARLAEIRALEERASAIEPVLYSDEVDVHLNPKIGRDWMLRVPSATVRSSACGPATRACVSRRASVARRGRAIDATRRRARDRGAAGYATWACRWSRRASVSM